jgi:AraC family transcriptional activator of pobA
VPFHLSSTIYHLFYESVNNTTKPLFNSPISSITAVALLYQPITMAKQVLPTYSICNLTETPLLQSELMADRFADYLEAHKDLHFPHKHNFYHLVYFTKGSGTHSIDFLYYPVEPGQVYFMIPGQVHSWDFNGSVDGYIINFSSSYLDVLITNPRYLDLFTFFSGNAKDQVINIDAQKRKEIENIFENILQEVTENKIFHDDMIRTAMIQLFILFERLSTKDTVGEKNNYNSTLLRNFKKLIDTNYATKKLTKEYAELLYVTPNHLNALCKDLTGSSAGQIIRDRVLLEAKRLLINATISVSGIANELNFIDNSYFTKFFKKYEGVTPETFRKQFDNKK